MKPQLFAVLLGGKLPGYTIEQHNVFFGIGTILEDLYADIKKFWSVAPKIHIDAYMIIDQIGDYDIVPVQRNEPASEQDDQKLFFVNLGGYREGTFEEIHKKLFVIAPDQTAAAAIAKDDSFFQEGVNEGKAVPHIDDRQMLDVFEDDTPLDVGTMVGPQGFRLSIRKARSGSSNYPKPVITGFHRIP